MTACDAETCLNGGQCKMEGDHSSMVSEQYGCECPANFTGTYCETRKLKTTRRPTTKMTTTTKNKNKPLSFHKNQRCCSICAQCRIRARMAASATRASSTTSRRASACAATCSTANIAREVGRAKQKQKQNIIKVLTFGFCFCAARDLCNPERCLNGASCFQVNETTAECKCAFGFYGPQCQDGKYIIESDEFLFNLYSHRDIDSHFLSCF